MSAEWMHNGHDYAPGRDEDAPGMADPRWCNGCGEQAAALYVAESDTARRLRVIHSAALTLPCTCRHDHDGVIGLPCARCQIVTEAEGEKL